MTIQSVIFNKRSLILASDLAVTTDEYKSYIGVKKIFEIDKNTPMGIMIKGAMEFENIPLETLIGEFKKEILDFETVENIKNDLLNYLSKKTDYTTLDEYLKPLLELFKNGLSESIHSQGFEDTIHQASKQNINPLIKKYSNFNNEFIDLIPEKYDKFEYNHKIWEIFSYELGFEGTGIIIAGFNKNDLYPSLTNINIYCNDNGNIFYEEIESKVNCDESLIRVYAINEEAYSFITGISDEFEYYMKEFVQNMNKEILSHRMAIKK